MYIIFASFQQRSRDSAVFSTSDPYAKCILTLFHMHVYIFQCIHLAIINKQQQQALRSMEVIMELAEQVPSFFYASLEQVLSAMHSIALNSGTETDIIFIHYFVHSLTDLQIRRSAMEILVTLCESAAPLVR